MEKIDERNVDLRSISLDLNIPFCLLLSIILSILSITSQSLWIDESVIAWLASHTTFQELNASLLSFGGSESQMPFYIWYIWCWTRLFGMDEIALRFSNLPFLFVFILVMQFGIRTILGFKWKWLIITVCPFVWFYMNEARPYIAVLAFSAVSVVGLLVYLENSNSKINYYPWLCILGLYIASGMNMLAIFLICPLVIIIILKNKTDIDHWRLLLKDWLRPSLVALPFFLLLGVWFLWTIWHGHGGMKEHPTLLNVAYVVYEFLGFQGLGPPRNVLRDVQSWNIVLQPLYLIPLCIGIIIWCFIILEAYHNMKFNVIPRFVFGLLWASIVGVALFYVMASYFNFRFVGRHLISFFPIFILIVLSIGSIITRPGLRNNLSKFVVFSLAVVWLLSSLRLIILDEYKKDDYRSAVQCAVSSVGSSGTILWAADRFSGSYYGLQFPNETTPKLYWHTKNPALLAVNMTVQQLEYVILNNQHPIIIAVSKPDLFDINNAVIKTVVNHGGVVLKKPNAFVVYKIT